MLKKSHLVLKPWLRISLYFSNWFQVPHLSNIQFMHCNMANEMFPHRFCGADHRLSFPSHFLISVNATADIHFQIGTLFIIILGMTE